MPAAGSKDALKNPGELKDDTSSSREEKQILMRALSSPPFGDYRVWWSLADSKYAGTALFVKKCFQPQKVFFNLDRKASKHEPDGRVILAEFETFNLLNTYAPNNGWKEEENSFPRRRKWDKRILEFVLQSSDKPLIWCGDLNVSHEEIDVSHPHFFSAAKLNGYVPPNKEDCGQPGFTLAERKRFGNILKEYVTPLENFVSMGKSRKRARMAKKAAPAKKPEKAVKFSTVMDTKNGYAPAFEEGTNSNCGSLGDMQLSNEKNSQTVLQSLGRRVFDNNIQGNLKRKDFDISKEAGGVNRAVARPFKVNVTENYLDIHLFWAGTETCCIPEQASFGFFCSLCFLSCFWFHVSMAQNATTDPSEVTALFSIFKQWDMQALPISGGEQCIGFAINGSEFEKPENNPPTSPNCCWVLNSKQAALFKRMIWEAMNKDYDKGKSRKRARMAKKAAPAKKPEKAVKVSTVMDTKNILM
ncbi:unnamed protein product [Prunus armeniaca]